jgi:hypothetical protein
LKTIHHIFCGFLFIIFSLSAEILTAQTILTPQNMGLGGGGTAYLTGPEALFINPANLRIRENRYDVRISLLNGGLYYDELYPESFGLNRFQRFFDINQLNTADVEQRPLTNDISQDLIDGNYGQRQQTKTIIHQGDVHWFGIKWVRPERTYALAARTRIANKFEVGRGLFTTSSFDEGSTISRNQFFSHTTQVLHEFSFGFGESFTYLNGQFPGLSEFIVGIAPKVVVPGSYQDVVYDKDFSLEPAGGNWKSNRFYRQVSAGAFTESSASFFNSTDANLNNASKPSLSDILQPQGIGFGLDAGVTYLVTFGDDLSVLDTADKPTEKSLRLSLSITDLGFIIYNSDVLQYTSPADSIQLMDSPPVSEYIYEGIPDEHYNFLSQFDDFSELNITEQTESGFKVGLPTSIQAGAVFQYNRLKAVGDISYSILKSAFTPPGLAIYTGLELRPLSYLPLRAGTRFAANMPGTLSLGLGFETGIVHINGSVMIRNRGAGFENELLAMSALGLSFYF